MGVDQMGKGLIEEAFKEMEDQTENKRKKTGMKKRALETAKRL